MIVCEDPSIHQHGYSFDLTVLLEGATDIIPERFTLTYSLDNDNAFCRHTALLGEVPNKKQTIGEPG